MLVMGSHPVPKEKRSVHVDKSSHLNFIVPFFYSAAPWKYGPKGFERAKDLQLDDGSVLKVANIVLYTDTSSAIIFSMDLLGRNYIYGTR